MNLLDRLHQRTASNSFKPSVAISESPKKIEVPSSTSGRAVGNSQDLERILALPRRPRPSPSEFDLLQTKWTSRLGKKRTNPCTCATYKRKCADRLLPVQAWALEEMSLYGGLLGPIEVGGGKTLLDLLAAMVVPDCKVAVLLIPPNLRAQLDTDWEFYDQHWVLPNRGGGRWFIPGRPVLHVLAYSELSSASNSARLSELRPDLIVADEAHNVRNGASSRGKRFNRYFTEHPDVRLTAWSGTLTKKSLRDYASLAKNSLKQGSPVPLNYQAVEEWAGALDPIQIGYMPTPPGALMKLCAPGENAMEGFSRRLLETPGVVSSPSEGFTEVKLTFLSRPLTAPKTVLDAYQNLQRTWQRPDGEELQSGLDVARCAREIGSGLYNHWIWPRKEPVDVRTKWLEVRKRWHSEVRERLKHSKEFLDSPLLAEKAAIRWHMGYTHIERDGDGNEIRRTEYPAHTKHGPKVVWPSTEWPEWHKVCDTAKPETEAVWIDDFMVKDAAAWGREHVGIIWYEHPDFGVAVAKLGGFVFYGPGDEANEAIRHERGDRTIVASILSHGEGKNLQPFFKNLVCQPPSDGARWEQLLGRTHRRGQLAPEVLVYVYRHTAPMIEALEKAQALGGHITNTFKGKQRLLTADTKGIVNG